MGYDIKSVEEIKKAIGESLEIWGINCDVVLKNNNKCIEIDFDGTYCWIRLLPLGDGKLSVNFSTVSIPARYRRKGVFSGIYENVKGCDCVGKVEITSVCTEEMSNWCLKHRLSSSDGISYYEEV